MYFKGDTASRSTSMEINTLNGFDWATSLGEIPAFNSSIVFKHLEFRGQRKEKLSTQNNHSCLSSWEYVNECTDIYKSFDGWRWLGELVSQTNSSCFLLATGSKMAMGFTFILYRDAQREREVGHTHSSPFLRRGI